MCGVNQKHADRNKIGLHTFTRDLWESILVNGKITRSLCKRVEGFKFATLLLVNSLSFCVFALRRRKGAHLLIGGGEHNLEVNVIASGTEEPINLIDANILWVSSRHR